MDNFLINEIYKIINLVKITYFGYKDNLNLKTKIFVFLRKINPIYF